MEKKTDRSLAEKLEHIERAVIPGFYGTDIRRET